MTRHDRQDDHGRPSTERIVEHLSTAECWRLLERGDLGRMAVEATDGSPDLFPVNYAVQAGHVYVRTASGAKLVDLSRAPTVAFEADGQEGRFRWSVVVRGAASPLRLLDDAPLDAILSSHPTDKPILVRIVPSSISGRRFRDAQTSVRAVPRPDDAAPVSDRKPQRIPHYPPPAPDGGGASPKDLRP